MMTSRRALLASSMLAGVLTAGSATAQTLAKPAPAQSAAIVTASLDAYPQTVSSTAPGAAAQSDSTTNGPPASADQTQSSLVQEVVVTGSRIAKPNLDQPTPVSTLSQEQIQNAGTGNLGDIISQIPATGFGGTNRGNSNNFGNSAGLSLINLRNLGVSRTLVLVDGERHVAGDISSNAVDINSIPTALVDHVEVTTGGASAVYGSDAVTGVVNIILKHEFEGVEEEAEGGGYDNGFGRQYNLYGTVGHNYNLGDGKLNITATAYWTKEDGIDARNIPTEHNYGTIANPNYFFYVRLYT